MPYLDSEQLPAQAILLLISLANASIMEYGDYGDHNFLCPFCDTKFIESKTRYRTDYTAEHEETCAVIQAQQFLSGLGIDWQASAPV